MKKCRGNTQCNRLRVCQLISKVYWDFCPFCGTRIKNVDRTNCRTRRTFRTCEEGLKAIREELEKCGRTSRTFWAQGRKYIVRRTTGKGHLMNITVKEVPQCLT